MYSTTLLKGGVFSEGMKQVDGISFPASNVTGCRKTRYPDGCDEPRSGAGNR